VWLSSIGLDSLARPYSNDLVMENEAITKTKLSALLQWFGELGSFAVDINPIPY
jgi:hypothetical protein